jgi:transposase
VYGYINRVRSSRQLEAEADHNIEVIWLLRHLKPDFRTIAAFRRINRSAFRQVFREFVVLCPLHSLFSKRQGWGSANVVSDLEKVVESNLARA